MINDKNHDRQFTANAPKDGVSRRDFMLRAGAAAGTIMLAGALNAQDAAAGERAKLQKYEPIAFSAEKPLRVALIGTGGRMNGGLLPTVLGAEGIEIVACVDIEPANLNKTLDRIEKAKGKRPEGFSGDTDYIKVLRRDDIQAALSACPCDLHAAIYVEALNNGKPIYGEKPAAVTLEETKLLHEAWLKSKSLIQIGFQRRVNKAYHDGIELIRNGEIGEPMEGNAAWNNTGGPLGVGRWLNFRARSGDWMLEQACHTWDVLGWALGSLPVSAMGMGRRDVYKATAPDRDVTDFYIATLEYPNNVLVNYNHTWFAANKDNGAISGVFERFAGLKGTIDLSAGRVSYTDKEKEPRLLGPVPDMTGLSVKHFFECVKEGKCPNSSVDNGIEASLTGLLIRKAVDERRRVTMEEIVKA